MAVGHIGSFTELLESLAVAVGSGMLLGGFAIGTLGLMAGRSRQSLAERALTDGYAGGVFGVGLVFVDVILRYGS